MGLERIRSNDVSAPRTGTGFWNTSSKHFCLNSELGLGCAGGLQPAFNPSESGSGWGCDWCKQGQTWVVLVQQPNFELENRGGENSCR